MRLGPDELHAGRGAGCPGVGPDVLAFMRHRMSGRWGRMSGLAGSSFCDGAPVFRARGPDVRGFRKSRMSGLRWSFSVFSG